MKKQIAIVQGHPDAEGRHFGHALADAYSGAARAAGHEVQMIDVARLDFPLMRTKADFDHGTPPDSICEAQTIIARAEHLVIIYPLWLGTMPALLKGFWEQVLRPGFVNDGAGDPTAGRKKLKGKTARIVVTMGMPALFYRWYFGAHGLKNLERNILGFCGIGPIRESLIGMVEAEDGRNRLKWLDRMRGLGRAGG